MSHHFRFTSQAIHLTLLSTLIAFAACAGLTEAEQDGPIHLLFLGHASDHHNSDKYFPMLAQSLGPDAIYIDYTRSVDRALDPDYLNEFDGLILYANHGRMNDQQMDTLEQYVESGNAFIPIHSASACFTNQQRFIDLVGAQFKDHGANTFIANITAPDHPAMKGVSEFKTWDETYEHADHNTTNRTVLMRRNGEPWTWVREQGEGRVFYTAYGHDERTWSKDAFQQLLKSGILWAVGADVRSEYNAFLSARTEKKYEKREKIPNYHRDEKLPYQFPLSPEDSMDYTKVPPGFDLKLFASEPQIVDPISFDWDRQGRLWVVESVDYPNQIDLDNGNDRIKILEDTNDDGRADEVTVFAKNLNIPTSLTFSNGGVVVSQPPHFLFLKDTDGDDKADVRTKLFSGWSKYDTHAGASNLRYGIDNWLYGTVGYAGFDGTVGGEHHKFEMGVYRFKPDGSDIEFLHQFNNNTWGLGFNRAGDVFGSTANGNPTFFGGIPATLFRGDDGTSAEMIADDPSFQPITPNVRQVDNFGSYTAGAGHAFASSGGFPPEYRNNVAFVNGPTGNLTGMYEIVPEGAGYKAINQFSFVASADEWFSPVKSEVGPDGALWLADWYDFIIQHNPTPSSNSGGFNGETGPGNAHVNPNRDEEHGRIYRVVWEDAEPSDTQSLAGASTDKLLDTLRSDNRFWRMTAQRILVQEHAADRQELAPELEQMVEAGNTAGIHALWTLKGIGALDRSTHKRALGSDHPALRKNACRALGEDERAAALLFGSDVLQDPHPGVRLKAFNALAQVPSSSASKKAIRKLLTMEENISDDWLKRSLKQAAARHGVDASPSYEFGENLLPNPSFESIRESGPEQWQVRTYSGDATHQLDGSVAHSGSNALKISSESGSDTSFYTEMSVEPNTTYRLSGWVKTKNVSGAMGGLFNAHELQKNAKTSAVDGTSDWTKVEVTFDTGNKTTISINCLFGGWGQSTGTVWYDDVSLRKGTLKFSGDE